jgi:hypothetical protein
MASSKSIWFHLGHAIERARQTPPPVGKAMPGLAERRTTKESDRVADRTERAHPTLPSADELMTAGVALVVDRALGGWGKSREPRLSGLIRAGFAGAAAALLVDLVRPLMRGDAKLPMIDQGTADRLIAGVGHGLMYGAVIEPRVPGPALLKGTIFGSAEYAANPIGGLSSLLGSHSPQNKLPILGEVLDNLDTHDRAYLEHLVFGIALALIYESSSSSNGMSPEEG